MNDTKFQDKIKAWAFPILLSIISVFLYQFYLQQKKLIDQQAIHTGQQELIMYRLNLLDKQIEQLFIKSK